MNKPDFTKLIGSQYRESYIKRVFPEYYMYLMKKLPSDLTFAERIYWDKNNISSYPICPVCGKRVRFKDAKNGYFRTCSYKCSANLQDVKDKHVQTCLERYGVSNYTQTQECLDKMKHTNLKRYGTENYSSSYLCREKVKNTVQERYGVDNVSKLKIVREKVRTTMRNRYGVDYYPQSKDYINKRIKTSLERYGVDDFTRSTVFSERVAEYKQKEYKTRKKNHSFNTSKVEQDFKQWLDNNHIDYIYQYKDPRFGLFICDFYFPGDDLFLEIHGNWTHGTHPYDDSSEVDRQQLLYWIEKSKNHKYYKNAIESWTIKDPQKLKLAKDSNLNYIAIYSTDLDQIVEKYLDFVSKNN